MTTEEAGREGRVVAGGSEDSEEEEVEEMEEVLCLETRSGVGGGGGGGLEGMGRGGWGGGRGALFQGPSALWPGSRSGLYVQQITGPPHPQNDSSPGKWSHSRM